MEIMHNLVAALQTEFMACLTAGKKIAFSNSNINYKLLVFVQISMIV